MAPEDGQELEPEEEPRPLVPESHRRRPRRWRTWSQLLWRVFGLDGWLCPHCTKPMKLRTVVIGPPATIRVIDGLERAARAGPAPPAAVAATV